MTRLLVKSWGEFQHYKERNPPWIKLHKRLLDNYEYHRLPDASKALAPMLWLLASESDDGSIEFDAGRIAFRLRTNVEWLEAALKPLIDGEFLAFDGNAITALAPCKSETRLETEAETQEKTESERMRAQLLDREFESWYAIYPVHKGRGQALRGYKTARKKATAETLLEGAKRYRDDPNRKPEFTKHPATWLHSEGWLDESQPSDSKSKWDNFGIRETRKNAYG